MTDIYIALYIICFLLLVGRFIYWHVHHKLDDHKRMVLGLHKQGMVYSEIADKVSTYYDIDLSADDVIRIVCLAGRVK
jgi:hypothetical protein